jgi:DNA-binding PadR family transcriptional regulator
MIKHTLLGLLTEGERHGWDLRSSFELLLADTWPLNDGQVYTTLARLERDGLVSSHTVEQRDRPDRRMYRITNAGRDELQRWLTETPADTPLLKDELFLKVLIHALTGSGNPDLLLHHQRQHLINGLAGLTRRRTDPETGRATALLLDGAILRLEADLKWLDEVELRIHSLA